MKITSVQSFGSASIADYYRSVVAEFKKELQNYDPTGLIGTPDEKLIEYFLDKYSLSPIEIDPSREIEFEKVVKKETYRTIFNDVGTKDVTYARIIFPLVPKRDLSESFKYHTQTHAVKVYEFDFNGSSSTVTIETQPQSAQAVIEEHKTLFSQRTNEINQNNLILKDTIKSEVELRKKAIQTDNDSFEAMMQKVTIPLKRKTAQDIHIPLLVREGLKAIARPSSTPPRELTLTEDQVRNILEVIDSDGRNFENTPGTFSKLSEPDLRNIMLSHLNFYFPDDATGETFINIGKTDIRLKVYEGQILVAECKYWHGEKELIDAIDQLFGYLTWRHNYGIIILFSKVQDFSSILDKISVSIKGHQSYKSGFNEISSSHFSSTHSYSTDSKKQIVLHTLVYNLYSKTE